MKLYGTVTSPFVRRVRIVAAEVGAPVELVDTFSDEGQAALRERSPIWKVPAAEFGGELVLDSHSIVDVLLARHGRGAIRPIVDAVHEANLHHVIDGALDAAINIFYLLKGSIDPAHAYLVKQRERTASALTWLDGTLVDHHLSADARVGVTEIALYTTLDWMVFRDAYEVSQHARLSAFRAHHAARPSFAATAPT
jgi:glutathione S-transferase